MAKNGLVFITKATFSGASAVNIDNCFSSLYDHYLIVRNFTASADNHFIKGNMRAGGTTEVGAAYSIQYYSASSTAITQGRLTSYTYWINALGYTRSFNAFAELWLSHPFTAVPTTGWADVSYAEDGSIVQEAMAYCHTLTTSYDGVTFTPNSGTITGSISVFGLVKS